MANTPIGQLPSNELIKTIAGNLRIGAFTNIIDFTACALTNIATLVASTSITTPSIITASGDLSIDSASTTVNIAHKYNADTLTLPTIGSVLTYQLATNDAFGRRQIWYRGTNSSDPDDSGATYTGNGSVFRMGSLFADGDPTNIISEGQVVYGQSSAGGIMDGSNYGFARIKPMRFQLKDSIAGNLYDLYLVNPTQMAWRPGGAANFTFNMTTTGLSISNQISVPSIITPAATDLSINPTTGFTRFNTTNITGISTAIGIALDFTSLINTNVAGATNLTIGTVLDEVRFTPGNGIVDFVTSSVINATITATSNNVAANSLKTATGVVSVAAATAPTTGQVLTATSATTATWQANSSLAWTALTTTTVAAAVNNGYIATGGALQTFTLPVTSAVGDIIEIVGSGAGGWVLAQNASQNVRLGNSITTTGVGGSLASTLQGDTLRIVCSVANTSWIVLSAVGNITIT
jgi:hypothetical protein